MAILVNLELTDQFHEPLQIYPSFCGLAKNVIEPLRFKYAQALAG